MIKNISLSSSSVYSNSSSPTNSVYYRYRFCLHTVKCQNSSISKIQFSVSTVLFQAVQFSICMQISSIWPIDGTLSGATTSGQSGPGSNGNEGVLCIPQSSSITGTSPSDCLVSYPGHSLGGESYPSAEKQSVYSTAPVDWAILSLKFADRHDKVKCDRKLEFLKFKR